MSMRKLFLLFVAGIANAPGAKVAYTLMPPAGAVAAGPQITVDLVGINPSSVAAPHDLAPSLPLHGRLRLVFGKNNGPYGSEWKCSGEARART